MTLQLGGDDRAYLRGARPRRRANVRAVRVVDLFCGCGGLTLGVAEAARALGATIDVRLAVERNAAIAPVYAKHFTPRYGAEASDVSAWFDRRFGTTLSPQERRTRRLVGGVDLLVGGPPCQGHSPLNNHTRGNDPKNKLYLAMVRAAEVLEPAAILIENVPALQNDPAGTLQDAVRRLTQLGYTVDDAVVSVAAIGVPQLRKRHILLAERNATPSVADAIECGRLRTTRTLRWAIGDLVHRAGKSAFDMPSLMSAQNVRRAELLLRKDLLDLPNRYRPKCQRNAHRYKSMYGRLSWDAPAQTITTGFGSPGQGRYLHPEAPRTLTPHEAARIQFIPDWYDFSSIEHRGALAEAIGNAVPPKLAFVLALSLGSVNAIAGNRRTDRP